MNTRKDPKVLALEIARRGATDHPYARYQIGAVIVDSRGRVLSWGWCFYHTHAEDHALQRVNRGRLEGARIFVAGWRRHKNRILKALPCQECFRRISKTPIREIFYTESGGEWRKKVV